MINIRCIRNICELGSVYPIHIRSGKFFHASVFVNLMTSMTKRLLPTHITDIYEVGFIAPQGGLDRLFVVPDVESTNDRNLARMNASLRRRYDRVASFSLARISNSGLILSRSISTSFDMKTSLWNSCFTSESISIGIGSPHSELTSSKSLESPAGLQ